MELCVGLVVSGRVDWGREALPFLVVSAIGLGLQLVAVELARRWLGEGLIVFNLAKTLGVGTIWLVKFFVYRNYVFADRKPSIEEAAAVAVTEVP